MIDLTASIDSTNLHDYGDRTVENLEFSDKGGGGMDGHL